MHPWFRAHKKLWTGIWGTNTWTSQSLYFYVNFYKRKKHVKLTLIYANGRIWKKFNSALIDNKVNYNKVVFLLIDLCFTFMQILWNNIFSRCLRKTFEFRKSFVCAQNDGHKKWTQKFHTFLVCRKSADFFLRKILTRF